MEPRSSETRFCVARVSPCVCSPGDEGVHGFTLTDDVRVLISAQASMLLLGLDLDEYPQLTSVIVHTSTVRLHGDHAAGGGLRSSATQTLAGQAHYRGPVVLSWAAARRGARFPGDGQNVVYHEFAHQLDMQVLCETRDEHEIDRSMAAGGRLIGVNARDLDTFELDPDRAARLRKYVPPGFTYVAESGVKSIEDAIRLRDAGVDAILVGSYLMQAPNPGETLRQLILHL